jgi:FtsP/CotA-like multicopper oxidase with cupredoxin domain
MGGLVPRALGLTAIVIGFAVQAARAEDSSPELINPPMCSAATASQPALKGICEVTALDAYHNKININLTAETSPIQVGGYTVETENYNRSYLTPVIQAMPGDTVAAHLENDLRPRAANHRHEAGTSSPLSNRQT